VLTSYTTSAPSPHQSGLEGLEPSIYSTKNCRLTFWPQPTNFYSPSNKPFFFSGKNGIRTHGDISCHDRLASDYFQPLSHLPPHSNTPLGKLIVAPYRRQRILHSLLGELSSLLKHLFKKVKREDNPLFFQQFLLFIENII
jgi:hypothetical protein